MDTMIVIDDGRRSAVEEAIAKGDAPSLQAAVELALDAWLAQRALSHISDSVLREMWDQGRASGPAGALDLEAVQADVRRALTADR